MQQNRTVYVCRGTGCVSGGGDAVFEALRAEVARQGVKGSEIDFTGCHGFCEQGPNVVVEPDGIFYTQLYTAPRGKNIVRVCRGTACHVRGGKTILKLVKQNLGLEEGETTPELEYTLETVACIGVCALAPNMVINSSIYGHLNPKKVASILGHYEGQ